MKQIFFSFIAAVTLLSSCSKEMIRGKGSVGSKTLSLPAFTAVESHYDIKAVISYGNTQEITATGYDNLLNILDVTVENGTLKLKYNTQYNTIRNSNVVVYVKIPALSKAVIHGSGNIDISGFTTAGTFHAAIHGSGDIRVTNSSCRRAVLDIYGSGHIEAQGLQSREADVQVHGSGHSYVSVADRLNANIFGSGNVYYLGNPLVQTSQHGSGRVIKRQ